LVKKDTGICGFFTRTDCTGKDSQWKHRNGHSFVLKKGEREERVKIREKGEGEECERGM
jgi:hypothetical protein